ncbi:hypothetical protein EJB05_40601, partial [Eragrostis curvula]
MVNWAIGGVSACPMDFYGGFKFGMYQKLLDQDDLVVMHDTGMTEAIRDPPRLHFLQAYIR